MTRLWTLGFAISLILWLLPAGSEVTAGSLYRCVTETEGTIYTDTPAQLEQCAPITASGAVTSLATGSSGGPPIGAPTVTPIPLPPELPLMMPPPPSSSDQAIAGIPQNAAPLPQPCPIGLNPLNPFNAPPCPTDEATPTATITVPSGPTAPPGSPTQP